jgi:predicted small metal-binding protein
MAKVYYINCRDVGVDCEFRTRANSAEEVIEMCADHARKEHGMTSFPPEFYAKMRQCLTIVEEEPAR